MFISTVRLSHDSHAATRNCAFSIYRPSSAPICITLGSLAIVDYAAVAILLLLSTIVGDDPAFFAFNISAEPNGILACVDCVLASV